MHPSRSLHAPSQQTVAGRLLGHRAVTALLVAVALSTGIVGIGHHHADDELLDEHHCALCHVQPVSVEPALADVAVSAAAPEGRTHVGASAPAERLAARLSPPLRGPPAC